MMPEIREFSSVMFYHGKLIDNKDMLKDRKTPWNTLGEKALETHFPMFRGKFASSLIGLHFFFFFSPRFRFFWFCMH